YLLTGSLHEVLGIPLTQDGVRLKTIAFWCIATLLVFLILRRLNTLPSVAFLFSGLFHLHLYKLSLEPGHPQEWILVLSLLSFWIMVSENHLKWFWAATLVGLIGMIKINCGLIFTIPLIVQSLISTKSVAAHKSAFSMVVAGGAISAITICGITLAMGVTAEQIVWGLVGQHRRFSNTFFHVIPVSPFSIGYAGICLWAIYKTTVAQHSLNGLSPRGYFDWLLLRIGLVLAAFVVAAGQVVTDWWTPLIHGLEPRGASNWLILIGPVTSLWLLTNDSPAREYRLYIIITTFLAPFMAYPTPGTQMSLGTAPSWIVLGLISSACIQKLISRSQDVKEAIPESKKNATTTGRTALFPMTILLCVISGSAAWYRWLSYSPLELPGSRLFRLDLLNRDREFKIAQAIRRTGCKHLVFDGHNHNRFFFWTETEPLTAANPTFWPHMLTEEEQLRVISALQASGKVCMVVPPESDQLASEQTRSVRQAFYNSWEEIERVDNWRIGIVRTPCP
ncbi:MAG: hypothetical protein ACK5T6_19120, partial [Pirellula sp.]